jgi:hypothetical protein
MSIPHVIRTPKYGAEQRIEANPLLDAGERAWSYLTKQVKLGDGERRWDDLPVAKIDFPSLDEKLALPEMQRVVTQALNNFTLQNPDDILDFIDNLDRSLT